MKRDPHTMPRNRSEKSPSGDPMIDDYLRAWLRWYRAAFVRRDPSVEPGLRGERCRTMDLLSSQQVVFMNSRLPRSGVLTKSDVDRLYGQEPEFQNAS